ncbi:MAG TPA: Bax inhibitor-1/YccA family protein [Dongiaceae bacterium]|nr:Bax inhibitor-1/YccA family protein [Dongiaceae bacterium]
MVTRPNSPYAVRGQTSAAELDVGLRAYMLKVYNYMTGGLVLTGILAYMFGTVPALQDLLYVVTPRGVAMSGLGWIVTFAPLALIFVFSFGIRSMSLGAAQLTFWVFSALMGMSLSSVFMLYTGVSIARIFFITAATFGAMSLYGYTTKRDLTGFGSFLMMGLFGLIIAGLVNIFLQSPALYFAYSVIGTLIFIGFTAYDTQKIKETYWAGDDGVAVGKKAIYGALKLYLDFINLFIMLLRLFGNRR